MSALRLGPETIASALGRSPPTRREELLEPGEHAVLGRRSVRCTSGRSERARGSSGRGGEDDAAGVGETVERLETAAPSSVRHDRGSGRGSRCASGSRRKLDEGGSLVIARPLGSAGAPAAGARAPAAQARPGPTAPPSGCPSRASERREPVARAARPGERPERHRERARAARRPPARRGRAAARAAARAAGSSPGRPPCRRRRATTRAEARAPARARRGAARARRPSARSRRARRPRRPVLR